MPFEVPPYDHDHENEVTLFGETNFRNQNRRFGIKTDDRRRHMYVVGKTGMGKTTLLENMVLADVYAGHGLAYIDPHGDTAEKLLDFIPSHRINDVVYLNPSDMEFPIGFNILETIDESQKHLVAAGLMGVFKKIWPDVWSARMEYILINTIMALLDFPGSTLLGINRLLSDEEYRKRVVSLIQDPVVKTFWVKEFASFSEKYRTEAVAPLQNKVGQFLSATIIRNIVAQVKSTINLREIMDTRKILIVNLAKGRIGEENSRLLGAMIITRLQLSAMERVDMPEKDRQDFYLYVDEFQNFATESFANILSEARKYRLALIVAHQYIEQLEEEVTAAVFGNVGTIIAFRVGAADAAFMENEFMPRFTPEDLVNLTKYQIYLKLMIDGAASEPFSANTLAPIAQRTGSTEKVVKVSRERYATPRKQIEDKVIRWAGFGTADTGQMIVTEDEEEQRIAEKMIELEASSPNVGEMARPADGGFGPKKKKEPKFEIPCAVCGKIQQLTFEPDWSKPWFCKEDLEKKKAGQIPASVLRGLKSPQRPMGAVPVPPHAAINPLVSDAKPLPLSALAEPASKWTVSERGPSPKTEASAAPPREQRPPQSDSRPRRAQEPRGGDAGRGGDRRGPDDRRMKRDDRRSGAPPKKPAPDPAPTKIRQGVAIPFQAHKPRIVISTGGDESDTVLAPKPKDEVPKGEEKPKGTVPERGQSPKTDEHPKRHPTAPPKTSDEPPADDAGKGGGWKPGQVIKF